MTLKCGLEVTQGHWKWCHSMDGQTDRFAISIWRVSMLTRNKNGSAVRLVWSGLVHPHSWGSTIRASNSHDLPYGLSCAALTASTTDPDFNVICPPPSWSALLPCAVYRVFQKSSHPLKLFDIFSKLDRVKTMGTRGKINAIWWNIKRHLQKLVAVRRYELRINLHNFTQKDLTKVKIFQKVFWNTLYMSVDQEGTETICSHHTSEILQLPPLYVFHQLFG